MAAIAVDTYIPFDSGAGANVQESEWRSMIGKLMDGGRVTGNGVIRGAGNEFRVYGDSSGSQVKVQTGQVWLDGHWGTTFSEKIVPIANGHATLTRIDTVVLRMSSTDNNIQIDVVQGVPSGSPVPIDPVINNSIYEIRLAHVNVPALDTNIAANQVFDARQYCDSSHVITRCTTDLVVNNSITLQTVTSMNLNLTTSAIYAVDGFLEYSADIAADVQIRINTPTGTSGRLSVHRLGVTTAVTEGNLSVDTATTPTSTFNISGAGTSNRIFAHLMGQFTTPHTNTTADPLNNPFRLSVQFAQNITHASNATFYTGSWIRLMRMY